jgi:hypothetical protein
LPEQQSIKFAFDDDEGPAWSNRCRPGVDASATASRDVPVFRVESIGPTHVYESEDVPVVPRDDNPGWDMSPFNGIQAEACATD